MRHLRNLYVVWPDEMRVWDHQQCRYTMEIRVCIHISVAT